MSSTEALQDKFQRNVAFRIRACLDDAADPLAAVLQAVRDGGARTGEVVLSAHAAGEATYEIDLFASNDKQVVDIVAAIDAISGVKVLASLDLAMESHRGGSCEMRSRSPIRSNTDLRVVYTPGVARVCKAIEADLSKAREFTGIANKVAICTNGTAILGLGDIGTVPGLPVMEGKASIFWEFAGISAEPVLIDTHDPDEFIHVMETIAGGFGAVQVEDVKAPECFRITRELDRRLGIPVMHDDQHGTAAVVMAALFSALKKTGKRIEDLTVSMVGAGAAGTAIADLLMHEGVADVILCDSRGALFRGREENMNPEKTALAERTNKDNRQGSLADVMAGTDLFVGVSQPNIVTPEMVRSMNSEAIVFALANPVSEISRDDALQAGAAVYADGRMINNAVCYPGIFRGALDAAAEMITMEMVTAAARAAAGLAGENEIMPEMMDPATHRAVAEATRNAAGQGAPLLP